ncbi:hypothetical protein C4K22_4437 [Pseudomonas chlororaphis subsp. aurantiaca]|nr:hypothetical protein C4K22_4437 [Pseudomonas chlororaphis subsp. aurantiaca]AZD43505.1 hypothetical protein C4K21_4445 [Pseudomonas chlororaphis subsp. aurantiaca]AZD62066.1 hypothetical protein C4K18_4107 [Pseudomonas chlororaphis subsp. aurantiaca]AZD68432.1 hypothetical protein C4K17_4560 [Pseudomonas chlororaphis subsp. aurantiaca]AZD80866.1 hypothetical protein C4K15_4313 [Pseudomonas chlororaphis subsp. aurantiaca]
MFLVRGRLLGREIGGLSGRASKPQVASVGAGGTPSSCPR